MRRPKLSTKGSSAPGKRKKKNTNKFYSITCNENAEGE
jgi:hypothetical protein